MTKRLFVFDAIFSLVVAVLIACSRVCVAYFVGMGVHWFMFTLMELEQNTLNIIVAMGTAIYAFINVNQLKIK